MRRILITGSRNWPYAGYVAHQIEQYLEDNRIPLRDVVIVHGACPTGADEHANEWAYHYGVTVERWAADWEKHGHKAGPIRNREMVAAGADICLAFQVNGSKGTQNTIDLCKQAGIPVHRIQLGS